MDMYVYFAQETLITFRSNNMTKNSWFFRFNEIIEFQFNQNEMAPNKFYITIYWKRTDIVRMNFDEDY